MHLNPIATRKTRLQRQTFVSAMAASFNHLTRSFGATLLRLEEVKRRSELSPHLRQDIGLEAVQLEDVALGTASSETHRLFNHAVRMEMMRRY